MPILFFIYAGQLTEFTISYRKHSISAKLVMEVIQYQHGVPSNKGQCLSNTVYNCVWSDAKLIVMDRSPRAHNHGSHGFLMSLGSHGFLMSLGSRSWYHLESLEA